VPLGLTAFCVEKIVFPAASYVSVSVWYALDESTCRPVNLWYAYVLGTSVRRDSPGPANVVVIVDDRRFPSAS
jgi:hypothetical protein